MKKLGICLMNDSFPPVIDGVANVVVNYADCLSGGLANPFVVAPDYPGANDNYPYPVIRYKSFNTEKLVGYRTGNPLNAGLLKRITAYDTDIIHTHCPFVSNYLARMVRELTSAPVIMTYHTKYDIDIANQIKLKTMQETAIKKIVENISACDEVWTVSRGAGENLRSLGYDGEYIVMENGVDFPRGKAKEEQIAKIDELHHIRKDVPVFMFAGRMMWYKGQKIIIDALSLLKKAGKEFFMIFVGGGLEEKEIKKYVSEKEISENCVFTGAVEDRELLRAYFSRADLFLFPSTFDTNGIVVREAAACALASVLVKDSCAAEGVTDKQNGFLIEENEFSMFECLKERCDNIENTREVGYRALEELYISWEDSVKRAYDRYLYVYEKYTGLRRHSAVKREKNTQTAVEFLENIEKLKPEKREKQQNKEE